MPLCSATHFPVRRCNGSRTAHASTAPIVPLSPSRRKKLSIAVSHRMPLCLRTMAQAHYCLLSAVFCNQEQSEQICVSRLLRLSFIVRSTFGASCYAFRFNDDCA